MEPLNYPGAAATFPPGSPASLFAGPRSDKGGGLGLLYLAAFASGHGELPAVLSLRGQRRVEHPNRGEPFRLGEPRGPLPLLSREAGRQRVPGRPRGTF